MKHYIYKRREDNKGITLIALVITIIVLLILAGITITNLFGGDNSIEKASDAKIKAELAEIEENIKFAVMEINSKYYTQTEEREKSSYYENKETFIEEGKFDSNNYNIKTYNKDRIDVGIIELKDVSKNNGTGTEYTFEIDIGDNMIICTSHKMAENTGGHEENQDYPVQTGRIFYETNGGRFEDESLVKYEYASNQIITFSIPVKDNCAFDGWYLDPNYSGEKMYSTTRETTGDITLYAKWIGETNTGYFTYNSNKNTITGFSDAGVEAFKNGQIKEIIFPKQNEGVVLTAIGSSAFSANNSKISENNISIEKIVIPDSVGSLSTKTFANLTSLKDITLPISLNTVVNTNPNTNAAFYGVTGITNVRLTKGTGEGVNYSGTNGSYTNNCYYTPWYLSRTNDIQLTIDEGIVSIGESSFYQCTGIKNLSIPNSVTTIGRWAFYECSSMSGELTTIGNATTIGKSAFCRCSSITGTLTIPSGITKLDQSVFWGTGITKLIIHDNVTSLDVNTFRDCTSLTDITLPISLNTVVNTNPGTNAAFYGTTNITKIRFTKGTGEAVDYSNSNGNYTNKCFYTPWYLSRRNDITITIDEGIEKIGAYTFFQCIGLKNICIPNSIKTIGQCAFYECTSMSGELTMIGNVTELGKSTFYGCSLITGTLTIPSGITKLNQYVFKGTGISKLIIHDNVTNLDVNTFAECTSLTDITLPISLNVVVNTNPGASAAFYGVTGIKNVRLTKGTGEGVNYSGTTGNYANNCFYTPWYLSRENSIQLIIDEGVTSIGECTFYQCTGLKNISIPTSVTTIGRWAFYECSSMSGELTTIGNVTTIGKSAFYGCSSVTGTLTIPEGITSLDQYVFYGTGITKLIIHDNVENLNVNTFRECKSLTDITLPISLNTIVNTNPNSNSAFYGTNNITKVKFTKGTGTGFSYSNTSGSYTNNCNYTPWYLSRNNTMTIEIDSGITSIGNYTFYGLNNATIYYNGTQSEWSTVTYNSGSNPQLSNIQFH